MQPFSVQATYCLLTSHAAAPTPSKLTPLFNPCYSNQAPVLDKLFCIIHTALRVRLIFLYIFSQMVNQRDIYLGNQL